MCARPGLPVPPGTVGLWFHPSVLKHERVVCGASMRKLVQELPQTRTPFECSLLQIPKPFFQFFRIRKQGGKLGRLDFFGTPLSWLGFMRAGNTMAGNSVISTSRSRMASGFLKERKRSKS